MNGGIVSRRVVPTAGDHRDERRQVLGVGAQPVDGLRGERDEPPGPQQPDRRVEIGVVKNNKWCITAKFQ